ncbi:MAG: hypothetical protein IT382_11125 [Deltaproteobacteria bacterium]|jgi:hypothetical protein|nr:hypothetical protein [Deltaproteobacteria bacterium]
MAKTLAALETEVRSHLDDLPAEERVRWGTLRAIGGVVRVAGVVLSAFAALAVFANTAPALLGAVVGVVVLSAGLLVTRTMGGWITLVAVKSAVRALERAHAMPSVGGATSVAMPPPSRSTADRKRNYPAPRPKKERTAPVDQDARDFDDAG